MNNIYVAVIITGGTGIGPDRFRNAVIEFLRNTLNRLGLEFEETLFPCWRTQLY